MPETRSLFDALAREAPERPLADRLRPGSLDEVVGQDHLVRGQGPIARMVEEGEIRSMVLWGPPGCGKTTIARLLAEGVDLDFVSLSAVGDGIAELRKTFARAETRRQTGRGTLLFVDEIHRFNRSQQDTLLPAVEDGTVVLVGATTENPSFEDNAALLSRCRVLVLHPLDRAALEWLLERAETRTGRPLPVNGEAREALLTMADGDGRMLINFVEDLAASPRDSVLTPEDLALRVQRRAPRYDRAGESHYNLISALHKSVRGSDPDAALYWLARMLAAGEDPKYLGRRILRMAVEDIGLADPQALVQTTAAFDTYRFVGSPEGELALAQAVVYLATAPKSNALYRATKAATQTARESGSLPPPTAIRNAPTRLLRDLGYGKGYVYDHDAPDAHSGQDYFPESLEPRRFYRPTDRGHERDIARRLAEWEQIRKNRRPSD